MIRNRLTKLKGRVKEHLLNSLFDYLMKPGMERKGRTPFDSEELKLLRRALISQNLCCIGGQMVPALEEEFAVAYDALYAVASTSGTAAIHVALGALDLNPGDEVITAPITDLGTIIPILYQNAIPVFADIDDSYNMDPGDVERQITPQTRAIIVVHLFGNPCDMDAMMEIAKRHGIPLIEDCSQAHMTEYKGRYVGTIGDIGCFSFQQSKHMTTGDGGMTITSNRAYYERMKLFADKGWTRRGYGPRAYLFHAPNYRMTELVGAVGLAQLKKVAGVVEKRRELGEHMSALLSQIQGVTAAPVTPGARHSYWLYPFRVEGAKSETFAQELRNKGVSASAGYIGKPIYLCAESLTSKRTYGNSQCPFTCNRVAKVYEYKEGLCPRAEEALEHLICIALDESWDKQDVDRVALAIAECVRKPTAQSVSVLSTESGKEPSRVPRTGIDESNKVRIGIVGCGQIGRWHLDAYRQNSQCEVAAVADTNFESAQVFAQQVRAEAYRSTKEMIDNEILHGVSICTVPSTHRDIALDLLRAGIHVLCEKPVAISAAQAEEMFNKAKEKNLLLLPAFKFRFFDEVVKAKELAGKEALGRIVSFRLMFGGYVDMGGTWYAQREISGGGVLMDNGPHAVDLIRHLFGEIESVSAEIINYQSIGVEDTARLNCTLVNGVSGTIDLSWSVAVPSRAYLEIYGERGAALLDSDGITYRLESWKDWKRIENRLGRTEAFGRQIDHFADAIRGKGPFILGNGEGVKSQVAVDAAYESVRRDRKVSLVEYVR